MSAHFEAKRGFTNLGFDGKASQTKQIDNTLVVKSNVTCISDGTFLEYFQPKDGTDQTYGLELHKVVKKYEAEESCEFIEADSTAVNTGLSLFFPKPIVLLQNFHELLFFFSGPHTGAIATLEKRMGVVLFWVGFFLF